MKLRKNGVDRCPRSMNNIKIDPKISFKNNVFFMFQFEDCNKESDIYSVVRNFKKQLRRVRTIQDNFDLTDKLVLTAFGFCPTKAFLQTCEDVKCAPGMRGTLISVHVLSEFVWRRAIPIYPLIVPARCISTITK